MQTDTAGIFTKHTKSDAMIFHQLFESDSSTFTYQITAPYTRIKGLRPTAVTQIISGDMDRKQLAETVSRMDADAEPPRTGSRRVSVSCFRFMSVVNNGFSHIHWHRDMNCVSSPKTRRRPIRGGSNPASMRDTVLGDDTQSMPLIFVGQ